MVNRIDKYFMLTQERNEAEMRDIRSKMAEFEIREAETSRQIKVLMRSLVRLAVAVERFADHQAVCNVFDKHVEQE